MNKITLGSYLKRTKTRNTNRSSFLVQFLSFLLLVGFFGIEGVKGQVGTYAAGATTASGVVSNITFGTLARGAGVISTTASGYYVSSTWDATTRAGARTNNEYHGFSVQSNSGYTATYTSFTYTGYRTAAGPTVIGAAYSTDGGSSWTESPDLALTNASTDYTTTWDFTDFATSNSVIFRVYGWSASGTGNLRTKDFVLNGSVATSSGAPTVSTPTATTITNTSATLGATVTSNGGATLTARGTAYKTVTGVIATDNQLAEGGTTVAAFSHSRTSLSPQTQYFYVGYATNASGTGISTEGSFRTLSNPPTAQPSSFSTTAGSSSLVANWTTATFPGSGATNTGYALIYAASPSTPTLSSANGAAPTAGVGTLVNITSGATLTSTISSLTNGTTYNLLLVPYTWDGANATTYNYLTTSALTTTGTPAAISYTWNGGISGAWSTAGNWSPTGVPTTADNIAFNTGGNISVTSVPSVSLGSLTISTSGTAVTLAPAASTSATITLSNASTALSIAANTTLNLIGHTTGSATLTIAYSGSGNTASMAGTLNLQASGSGAGRYIATNSTTTISGNMTSSSSSTTITSTTSNLIFSSTGKFQLTGGTANSIPTATWQTGSTVQLSQSGSTAITMAGLNGQSFSNFTVDATHSGTINFNASGSTISFTINGDYIQSGSPLIELGGGTGTTNISLGGAFQKTAGTISASTTTTNAKFTLTSTTSKNLQCNSSGWVDFTIAANAIYTLNGTLTVANNPSVVTVNGTLDFGTNIISGTTSSTFTSASNSTLITANTGGLALTGATGSVQVGGTRTYSTGANYTYNNSASQSQVTGTGLPTSGITGTVTINNASGVTLSQALGFTGAGALTLTSGKLTNNGFALTLANTTAGSTSSYIVTDATGTVTMSSITTSAAKTLPIGTASSYAPLRITASTGTTSYTAYVSTSMPVTVFDATKTVGLAWSINGTNAPSSVVFQWNSDNQGASFTTAGTIDMGRATNVSPTSYTVTAVGSAAGTDPNTITASSGFATGTNWYVVGNTNAVRLDAPTVATTAAASSITTSAASSGGQTVTGNALSAKGVVWNTSTAPTVSLTTKTDNGTSTANFTSSLSSLSPETQYFVRAYATNAAGTGYAPEVNFRTLSNPATVQASSFAGNATSITNIDLTWNAATFPGSGATATGYVLLRATSPNTPSLVSANGAAPSAGSNTTLVATLAGSNVSYSNSGLTHTTTYNYLLVPFTWDGTNAATYNYLTSAAPSVSVATQAPALPTITTGGALSAVSTVYGTASATPTSFTVSGASLTNDIVITPPTGFEVATTIGGSYSGTSLTLTQSGGVVNTTTIYVRLAATTNFGTYSGNITLTSDDVSNPASTTVATASSNVTAAPVTITGITGANKTYDGKTTATVTGTAVYSGLKNGDIISVTGTPSYTFATATVGTGKGITVTGFTAPNSNYSVSQPTTLTANITTAPLTITGISINNKTYNGTTAAAISGTAAYSGLQNGESFAITGTPTAVFGTTTVGTAKSVTVSGYTAPSSNYSITQPTGLTADITVASLSITANNVSKVYGATLTGASGSTAFISSGLQNSETIGSVTIAYGTGSLGTATVGSYTGSVTPSAATGGTFTASNYSITYNTGNITVTAAPLTITGLTGTNKTYNGTTTASVTGSAAYSGLQNGESFSVTGTPSYTFATASVGTGKAITVTGYTAPSSNYSVSQPSLTANITTAPLTITGISILTKTYTGTNAASITGSASYSGLVNSETFSVTGTPSATFTSVNVGTGIAVTISGYTAPNSNYSITQPAGLTGTITQASQTITFNQSLSYSTATANFDLTATASSSLAVTYVSSNLDVATVVGTQVTIVGPGSTTITASQAGNTNYVAASDVVKTLTVTPIAYKEDFGSSSTVTLPYSYGTNATGSATLATGLGTPSWAQSLTSGGLVGNTGGAMTASISSTYTVTATIPVTAGYQFTPSSITFDSRITSTGPTTLNISISGTGGSTSITTYTLDRGNTFVTVPAQSFANTSLNLTGTITLTFSYSGSSGGNARLDNVNLGGTVVPSTTVTYSNVQYTSARNISRNATNVPIYRVQVDVTNAASTLSSLAFTTPADNTNNSYINNDITKFGAFLTTSTTFNTSTQLGSYATSGKVLTNSGETGINFTGLSTTLSTGTTYYIWLTADIPSGATSGRTITVNAPTITVTGITVGTLSATGVQTIAAGAPTNVYFKASPGSSSATDPGNWSYSSDGSAGNDFQGAISDNDINWNIRNSNVTLGANWTLGGNSKVIVGDGTNTVSFSINSGTLNGTVDVANSGTLNIVSASIPTLGTLASGSTVNYSASGSQTVTSKTYGNLTIGGSGTKTLGGGITVSGTLTINGSVLATSTYAVSADTMTLGTLGTSNATWGSSASSATYKNATYFGSTGSGLVTVNTNTALNSSISGVASSQSITYGTASISLTGTVASAGTYPANGETVSITINGATQTTTTTGGNGSFAITYNTSTIPYNVSAYTITYAYASNGFLNATTNTSTALTVNKATVTITPNAGQSKFFGAVDPTFTYGASPAVSLSGALGRATGSNVGTYAYTLGTLSAGANYTLSLGGANTFAINPASVTITPDASQSKVYGETDPTFTYSASPSSVSITGALSRADGSNVGTYAYTLGSLSAGDNYTLSLAGSNTFAITPASVTITPDADQSKEFGDTDPAFTYSASPSVTISGALGRDAGSDAGTYGYTLGSLTAGDNYTLSLDDTYVFTITPISVTITPDASQSKVYGETDPTFTFSTSPEVFPSGELSRAGGSNVGTYAYTLGTLSAGDNYTLSLGGTNTFSITPAASSVTVTGEEPFSYVYDTTAKSPAFTKSGSTASLTYAYTGTGSTTYNNTTAPTTVGTYSVTATVEADSNYATASATQAFSITKATPTATVAVSNSPVAYTAAAQSATVSITASSVPGTLSSIATGGAATQTAAGTYEVTASFVPNDTVNYDTLTELSAGDFVISSTTTWNGSAWSFGTPTAVLDAELAADYTSGSFTAKSLTVNANKSLTVATGTSVKVVGALVNNGTITVENNANLIQTAETDTNSGSGTATVVRNSNALKRMDYTMWSSPVHGDQTLLEFSPLTSAKAPAIRFYIYDAALNQYVATAPITDTFAKGTGYLIRMPNEKPGSLGTKTPYYLGNETLSYPGVFTGTLNNGTVDLTNLTSGKYYSVGNPYPSTISADAFLNGNETAGTLYFWRKTNGVAGSAYATYTLAGGAGTDKGSNGTAPNGTIQVGQGFIVKATSTALSFTNEMRETTPSSTQFLRTKKAANKSRVWLSLSDANGGLNQAMIAYIDGATLGVDDGYDGKYFNDSKTALTSTIAGEEYTIQARPTFDATDVVALGFKTDVAGDYSIALDSFDGLFASGQEVYLVDAVAGKEIDLKAGSYSFTTTAGIDNARFSLKYQKTLKVDAPAFNDNSVKVYKNNGSIVVNSTSKAIKTVAVYDTLGRLLVQQKNINATTATISNLKAARQVLIVKISADDNSVVTKKVLN